MILYELKCEADHRFEAWFRNSETFDVQSAKGDIECPFCGGRKIVKAPMAPSLATGRGSRDRPNEDADGEAAKRIMGAMRKLRDHVERNFDYVGHEFAEEARRIHYGDADERGVYGEATANEVKDLGDEGIGVLPLPSLPRRNG